MKTCTNVQCPELLRSGTKDYHDTFEVCPHCGGSLVTEGALPSESVRPGPWKRLLVSVGVLVVCWIGMRTPLPTLPNDAGFNQPGSSILALGLHPLFLGFVLVEVVAFLLPPLQPLRFGDSGARATLNRAALGVGLLLALFQGMVLTVSFAKTGAAESFGSGFRLVTLMTLVGGVAALAGLARLIDRSGLGGGFAVLMLMPFKSDLVDPVLNAALAIQAGRLPASVLLHQFFYVALLAGATLWLMSRFSLPSQVTRDHPALISRPACGVAPFVVGAGLVTMLTAILSRLHYRYESTSPGAIAFTTVVGLSLAVLFAYLFNRPEQLLWLWRSLQPNSKDGKPPQLGAVFLECTLFVALVLGANILIVNRPGNPEFPRFLVIITSTAILCDLWREWRQRQQLGELVSVREVHQPYAVTPVLQMLKAEGIPAFAQSHHLRSFLQFFGPYIPIRICVPSDSAARAHELIQARWPKPDTAPDLWQI